jgi:hypothetical protein
MVDVPIEVARFVVADVFQFKSINWLITFS